MRHDNSDPGVLHVVGGVDHRGGVNSYVAQLVTLDIPGVQQKVWRHRTYENPLESDVLLGNAAFTDLSAWRDFVGAIRDLSPLLRWLRKNPSTILHAHSRMGVLLAWFVHKIYNVPVVITIHAFVKNISLYRKIFRSTKASVIFNSAETCRHFGLSVTDSNVQMPFISWPSVPPVRCEQLRFVAAGSIIPVKQVHLMLQAFDSFQARRPSKLEFHMYGVSPLCPAPAYQQSILQQAKSIPGTVLHEYDPNWTDSLRSGDVFVHVRPDESFGIVLLEAFSRGLKMIVPPRTFLNEFGNLEGVFPLPVVTRSQILRTMELVEEKRSNEGDLFLKRLSFSTNFSAQAAVERIRNVYVKLLPPLRMPLI